MLSIGATSAAGSLLPPSARFIPSASEANPTSKVVLLDVMDTLIVDPFFRGMHCDVFGCASMKELFSLKDPDAFIDFECGTISEDECLERFFKDRRPVDRHLLRSYLLERYQWIDGMRELLIELQAARVPMATFSNYPAAWAELVEESTQLSTLAPWAFISGEQGVRKPDAAAFAAALKAVDRKAEDVIFVDDSKANVEAAIELGIPSVRFQGAAPLRAALHEHGLDLLAR